MGYRHLIIAVLVALTVCVAATAAAAAHAKDSAGSGSLTFEDLQAAMMSFADSWASQIGEATARLATQMVTPQARNQANHFGYYTIAAAFDIAAGRYPGAALLDMLVLVTLNRMVWEEYWMPQVYGQSAMGMVTTLRKLEEDIWALAAKVLTPTQRQEVLDVLRAWRTRYPDKVGVSFIRFSDFGELGRKPSLEEARKAGGLLAPIKQAAQAADEIRSLGERALYSLMRLQELTHARAKLMAQELLTTPEIAQLLADVTGFRKIAERYAEFFEALPAQLTEHTRVTIDQTMAQITRQSASLTDHVMQQVSAERQAVMRQSASLIDHVMQQVSVERNATIEQAMRGIAQERQVALAQILQGVSQERQALLAGIEQVLDRGEQQAARWLTHGFVLLAALILIFFVVRLAYRYAADRPVGIPSWRWAACAGLGGLALLVVVTVLVYIQRSLPPMSPAVVRTSLREEPSGVGLPQGDEALRRLVNLTLEAMYADGTMAAMYQRWFQDSVRPSPLPAFNKDTAAPELVAPATTNVPPMFPTGQGTPSPARQYVVQKGDTLSRIAGRVYGDMSPPAWKRIYDANKAVIGADSSQLRMGMRLTIPES